MLVRYIMNSVTISLQAMMISQRKYGKVVDGKDSDGNEIFHYRMDIPWWYISHLTISGTNVLRFMHLNKISEIVLVMPHCNAELERLFTIVKKTKTDSSLI